MPDQIAKAAQNQDWSGVAIRAIDVDPRNVVVIALVVLIFLLVYLLGKFINAKFIAGQVTKVVSAAGDVTSSNQCAIESNTKLSSDLQLKLDSHASAVARENRETRESIEKLRRELNDRLDSEMKDFKLALGNLASGNKTTAQAIEKYQAQVNTLQTNFDFIVSNIRKKNQGGA